MGKSKDVMITVNTVQGFEDEVDEIELITEGKMTKKSDRYIVEYEESEISGMKGTHTTLEIKENLVTLVRTGTTNSNLCFEAGKEHVSLYGTEYLAFEVVVKPSKVNVDVTDKGGKIELDYIIETQRVNVSDNKLVMTIKEIN